MVSDTKKKNLVTLSDNIFKYFKVVTATVWQLEDRGLKHSPGHKHHRLCYKCGYRP